MGYGSRALQLLQEYYELKYSDLSDTASIRNAGTGATAPSAAAAAASSADGENTSSALHSECVEPRADLPPLLQQLHEVPPPRAPALHYVGVAFGLTHELFRFWKRAGYIPVYLRQTSVCWQWQLTVLCRNYLTVQNKLYCSIILFYPVESIHFK